MTRVLVAEDQPLVRGGIVMLLSGHDDIDVVAEAADGNQALHEASATKPDLVVLDLRMPGLDGVEVTRRLVSDPPQGEGADQLVKVLVLTTFDDDDSVYGALRAGASGFLMKDGAPRHLVEAVRAVAAGDSWLDPSIAGKVIRVLHDTPRAGSWSSELVDRLSPREREILVLIAHGMTNSQITDQLTLSEATVKTHVSRILMKTGCRDRAQAVVLAYRSGFVSAPPSPG